MQVDPHSPLAAARSAKQNTHLAQGCAEELDVREEGSGLGSVLVPEDKVDEVVEARLSGRPLARIQEDGSRLVVCEQAVPGYGVLGSVHIVPEQRGE